MSDFQYGERVGVDGDATDNTNWPLFGASRLSYGFDYCPPFTFVRMAGDGDLIVEDSTGEQMDVSPQYVRAFCVAEGYPDSLQDDPVHRPRHYRGEGGLEAADVIEAFDLDWHLGSAAKYVLRAGKKDDFEQDIDKAIWFLNRAKDVRKREAR